MIPEVKDRVTIIAHRGYWKFPEEKNTKIAFERAPEGRIGYFSMLHSFLRPKYIHSNYGAK